MKLEGREISNAELLLVLAFFLLAGALIGTVVARLWMGDPVVVIERYK